MGHAEVRDRRAPLGDERLVAIENHQLASQDDLGLEQGAKAPGGVARITGWSR